MQDSFARHAPGLTAPVAHAEEIVPNDADALITASRALYVGSSGDVRVRMVSGETVTFPNLQGGLCYPFRIQQVFATGTTATGLLGVS